MLWLMIVLGMKWSLDIFFVIHERSISVVQYTVSTVTYIYWILKKPCMFCIAGPLWGEFTSHWWFPSQNASNAESISMLWCLHETMSPTTYIYLLLGTGIDLFMKYSGHHSHLKCTVPTDHLIQIDWKSSVKLSQPNYQMLYFRLYIYIYIYMYVCLSYLSINNSHCRSRDEDVIKNQSLLGYFLGPHMWWILVICPKDPSRAAHSSKR